MYRHAFEPLSLVFGIILVVAGLPFLIGTIDVFDIRWSWVGPIIPLAIGGALLLSGLRRGSEPQEPPQDEPLF